MDDSDDDTSLEDDEEEVIDDSDIFTSFGNLRVRIIEAVDALDAIERNSKVVNKYWVFASVGICGNTGDLLRSFDTTCKSIISKGSCSLIFGEEFYFDVYSNNDLAVGLYAFSKSACSQLDCPDEPPTCLGKCLVPISRLGDGVTVSKVQPQISLSALFHFFVFCMYNVSGAAMVSNELYIQRRSTMRCKNGGAFIGYCAVLKSMFCL